MEIYTFTPDEEQKNLRIDKFLSEQLPDQSRSYLQKLLKEGNVTVNEKTVKANYKVQLSDTVKLELPEPECPDILPEDIPLDILYEDEDVLIINKPKGMLSQKSSPSDFSANEYILDYLLRTNQVTAEELKTFRPSICNRLDRNTSGLLIAGKSLKGLQNMAEQLKSRSMKKYYRCIVKGTVTKTQKISGYLLKDEKTNQVTVLKENTDKAKYIETEYQPIMQYQGKYTLLEVHLITGRSHQIRAHLASIGNPILGDEKYGNHALNQELAKRFSIKGQLLHAYRLEFPDGFIVTAPLPEEFSYF